MSRDLWINQALFQLSWPACVVGAAFGQVWPGILLVGAFALWQLSPRRIHPADPVTILMFVVTGIVLDSFWPRLGIVEYATAVPFSGFAPLWLVLLWTALGLTVHHSLAVFRTRWKLFVLLAMIGSPLSYTAAAGLGAVTWTAPGWLVVLCMGPIWALLVGALFRLAGMRANAIDSGLMVAARETTG